MSKNSDKKKKIALFCHCFPNKRINTGVQLPKMT